MYFCGQSTYSGLSTKQEFDCGASLKELPQEELMSKATRATAAQLREVAAAADWNAQAVGGGGGGGGRADSIMLATSFATFADPRLMM